MSKTASVFNKNFVHLHCHSEYSLLDGAVRIKDLVNTAKKYDMSAVAINDHGVLYGIIDFYKQAIKLGIKPIIGCEVYLAPKSRFEKRSRKMYHLNLLAVDKQGYHNLIKIVSKGWLEGFYYKPRIDKDLLYEYRKGIIALSACIQGEIPQFVLNNSMEEAKELVRDYQAIFGKDNFFLELQDHSLPEEKQVNGKLIEISKEMSAPLVVTNDVHYLNQNDADIHDVLLALQTGKKVADEDRLRFPNEQFYFKSQEEMSVLFPCLEDAYLNTYRIAERCNLKLDFNKFYLPDFPDLAGEKSPLDLLRKKCEVGLEEKGLADSVEARERLDYELSIIEKMGYASYFLIVWDFVNYAQQQGIRVGPGRGSAAGSLVSYLLKITKVNPLDYNLIFERFLNPERVTMPDIDIDFDEQRDKIIEYVKKRYGEEKVAQIGTFGTMAARAAIRDVGRVLNIPLRKVDRVAKLVSGKPGVTIVEVLNNNQSLQGLYQEDKEVKVLLDYARGIEGLPRHISTHAAGVVIGSFDLMEIVPLQMQDGNNITQLPMNNLEEMGLLKMDFLGLRNLTIINNTLKLIREKYGKSINIDQIPLDDPEVYKLLQRGQTLGVFQMESYLFKDLNQKLKPEKFTDLIALLALGRPGPLGSNLVDQFIESRHGLREPEYLHQSLKPILKETFGLILYQEQVMEIASKLAGYSMGEADLLRRGMGKKKKDLIANERKRFVRGAQQISVIPVETAHLIFDQMEYFSGYGFNKSHSAAYALLAYQTAYLKVKYPAEFMSALLSSVMNNLDKVGQYVRGCKEMGLEVVSPDINISDYYFKPGKDEKIHFGLKAIKNVGANAVEEIVKVRKKGPYHSLEDFIKRVDLRKVNIQVIESLIKSGAFSSFGIYRSRMLVKFEDIYDKVSSSRKEHTLGQTSFFDIVDNEENFFSGQVKYPEIDEFSLKERLAQEKEYLGIYLSGHPLDQYHDKIDYFSSCNSQFLKKNNLTCAGMIIGKKEHITKTNNRMAFLTIEGCSGKIEVIVFPVLYRRVSHILDVGEKILLIGRVDEESFIANSILSLDWPFLEIKLKTLSEDLIINLMSLIQKNRGDVPLFFKVYSQNKNYLVLSNCQYWVNKSEKLEEGLFQLLGKDSYKYY